MTSVFDKIKSIQILLASECLKTLKASRWYHPKMHGSCACFFLCTMSNTDRMNFNKNNLGIDLNNFGDSLTEIERRNKSIVSALCKVKSKTLRELLTKVGLTTVGTKQDLRLRLCRYFSQKLETEDKDPNFSGTYFTSKATQDQIESIIAEQSTTSEDSEDEILDSEVKGLTEDLENKLAILNNTVDSSAALVSLQNFLALGDKTWQEIVDHLSCRFGQNKTLDYSVQLQYLKLEPQLMSLETYIHTVEKLSTALNMSEEMKVIHLIKGLPVSIIDKMDVLDNSTFQKAIENIKKIQVGKKIQDARIRSSVLDNTLTKVQPDNQEVKDLSKQIENLSIQIQAIQKEQTKSQGLHGYQNGNPPRNGFYNPRGYNNYTGRGHYNNYQNRNYQHNNNNNNNNNNNTTSYRPNHYQHNNTRYTHHNNGTYHQNPNNTGYQPSGGYHRRNENTPFHSADQKLEVFNTTNSPITIHAGTTIGHVYSKQFFLCNNITFFTKDLQPTNRPEFTVSHITDSSKSPPIDLGQREIDINPDLPLDQYLQAKQLINEYIDIFAKDAMDLEEADLLEYRISLTDDEPVTSPPYKLSPKEQEEMDRQIDQLLKFN
ncbi:hypothetical protein WDU94_000827 [Cyamophila willieti]